MSTPTAICLSCGVLHMGWALKYQPNQHCSRCGAPLKILPDANEGAVPEVNQATKAGDPWRDSVNLSEGNRDR